MTMKKKKRYVFLILLLMVVILSIIHFNTIIGYGKMLLQACQSLIFGAMLAYILNLIMGPIQTKLLLSKNSKLQKYSQPISLAIAFVVVILILIAIVTLVVPNLIDAAQVLIKAVPEYSEDLRKFLTKLFNHYPQMQQMLESQDFNWNQVWNRILEWASKGFGGILNSTIDILLGLVNGLVNLFIIVIFSIYVLSDKPRFIRLYHFLTGLYLKPATTYRLTLALRTLDSTFKSFITGECIEATILTVMCMAGMFILQLPYAVMISILVGVINMIPMIGAFIGGGIGVFLIFTVSPIKALIFLVFLCVIQQIESNIFYPKIIGKNIGLPGIYVMMTIVIGGSLWGIAGMVFGVPIVASIYKLLRIYFDRAYQERIKQTKQNAKTPYSFKEKDPQGVDVYETGTSKE